MSVVVWAMVAIAFRHFAVLVQDRFWGGIVGALLAALLGGLLAGFALPSPGAFQQQIHLGLERRSYGRAQ
jgi:hypothetical protein